MPSFVCDLHFIWENNQAAYDYLSSQIAEKKSIVISFQNCKNRDARKIEIHDFTLFLSNQSVFLGEFPRRNTETQKSKELWGGGNQRVLMLIFMGNPTPTKRKHSRALIDIIASLFASPLRRAAHGFKWAIDLFHKPKTIMQFPKKNKATNWKRKHKKRNNHNNNKAHFLHYPPHFQQFSESITSLISPSHSILLHCRQFSRHW